MINYFFVGGVIAHTQFVAGNIGLSVVAIPAIRTKGLSTPDLLKAWAGIYTNGKAFYGSLALVSTLCYTAAAVQSPAARVPMLISAAFAISPLPITMTMMSNIKVLMDLESMGADEVAKEETDIIERIDKWSCQTIIRFALSGVGLANALYFALHHCKSLQ